MPFTLAQAQVWASKYRNRYWAIPIYITYITPLVKTLEKRNILRYSNGVMVVLQQKAPVVTWGRESVSLDALIERSLVRRLAGELPRETPLATGLEALDRALRGGLPRGRLVEITGPRGAGRLTLALRLAQAATAAGEFVTLVDAPDALDPRSAQGAGVGLDRFLWVRPRGLADAFKAADLALRAGGFGLVLLYLCDADLDALEEPPTPVLPHAARGEGGGVGRAHPAFVVGDGVWLRVIRAAERAGTAVVVVADRRLAGTFATATLELTPLPPRVQPAPGGRGLLTGRGLRLELTRSKVGRPADLGQMLAGQPTPAR